MLLQINHINRNSYYYFFLPNNILMLQNKEPNLIILYICTILVFILLIETDIDFYISREISFIFTHIQQTEKFSEWDYGFWNGEIHSWLELLHSKNKCAKPKESWFFHHIYHILEPKFIQSQILKPFVFEGRHLVTRQLAI